MLRAVTGASAQQLEAVTAERDFFREKYAEQMNEMEHLKGQVKESQRMIDKLRSQILDLELEKTRLIEQSVVKAPKQIESSAGSTHTSVTCDTDDDLTTKSSTENNSEPVEEANESSDVAKEDEEKLCDADVGSLDGGCQTSPSEESEEDQPGDDDDDDDEAEAENIRANAERMLLWANYQTSKRSTPNTSLIQESLDGGDDGSKSDAGSRFNTPSKIGVSSAIVYSLQQPNIPDDDSLSLSSSPRNLSEQSPGSDGVKQPGSIGKLFNNLKDMIDPLSESDSEDDSDDESSQGS
mmetsp:Transcript_15998/g.33831  ORF Transcript_15998/g.33831 Transcript_15998/m.33831 type:complete len:295 (-) Transcript_15998:95-979(-)|eukprot:CAMPEP_0183703918 /NCGR_PEP_ID=MMETSP0737-20130205/1462_1 /TAXON_ID=385413 /ORGANISM="Thalassiosira miniscula, Strain CCMP1093" /LENGTH=294 /DNA_ID=CAMNT_0025930721 /DNA_START=147 /DNA_END=1031 /DNA_ORIENTATION=-